MTTIYIARHGQNEDNVRGILNGHRDLPLTDLGRQQARQLARHIKDRELVFDAVYASPLGRAFETAAIVAAALGLAEPIVHDDLIERDFGIMTALRLFLSYWLAASGCLISWRINTQIKRCCWLAMAILAK